MSAEKEYVEILPYENGVLELFTKSIGNRVQSELLLLGMDGDKMRMKFKESSNFQIQWVVGVTRYNVMNGRCRLRKLRVQDYHKMSEKSVLMIIADAVASFVGNQ